MVRLIKKFLSSPHHLPIKKEDDEEMVRA